jgi:hypothetical protein
MFAAKLARHPVSTIRGTAFGSSNFGMVSGEANSSRDAQLSLRLEFQGRRQPTR